MDQYFGELEAFKNGYLKGLEEVIAFIYKGEARTRDSIIWALSYQHDKIKATLLESSTDLSIE